MPIPEGGISRIFLEYFTGTEFIPQTSFPKKHVHTARNTTTFPTGISSPLPQNRKTGIENTLGGSRHQIP